MPDVISRANALALGSKRYYTGGQCPKGHVSERFVASFGCCVCTYEKAKQWRVDNPETARALTQAWRDKHAETLKVERKEYYDANKELLNERWRLWRLDNLEMEKLRVKRYSDQHAEKVRVTRAKYAEDNKDRLRQLWAERRRKYPEHKRASEARRRARKRGAEGYYTRDDVLRLLELQKGRCVACFKYIRGGYHVDHKIPLSRGGSNWPINLQLLCPTDNMRKNVLDDIEYAAKIGRLL